MKRLIFFVLLSVGISISGCGASTPGGSARAVESAPPVDETPSIQSNEILAREAKSNRTRVKHILIGWAKDDGNSLPGGERSQQRSRAQADALAQDLLGQVRSGASMEALMAQFSDDPGSASSGRSYEVRPDATLVFEFKRLGLRLDVGEAGLVMSEFGWHVMKRVE